MDRSGVLAYILARFPATFGVCDTVLSQLTRLNLNPFSLLEVGAGPGTGSLAALEHFPTLKSLTLIEKEKAFLSASQEIFLSIQTDRSLEMTYLHQSYNPTHALAHHDVVMSSYFLNELSPAILPSVIESLWSTTGQYLILVEPGTPVGFEILRQARNILIKEKATIVAPCPHNNLCPMSGNDWCHFSTRIQRDKLHQAIKGTLSYEDEKYSYLIASKSLISPQTSARIIKRPLHHSGHLTLPLCTHEGLKDITLTKRKDKEKYKSARHLKWGDEF